MECGGGRSQLTALVPAESVSPNPAEVHLTKGHRAPTSCGLCGVVDLVNKDAKPLISCTMRVHGATRLARCFDLDASISRFHAVPFIDALDDEVRMTVEVAVDDESPRM